MHKSTVVLQRHTNTLRICDVLHISDLDQLLQLLHQVHLRPVPVLFRWEQRWEFPEKAMLKIH